MSPITLYRPGDKSKFGVKASHRRLYTQEDSRRCRMQVMDHSTIDIMRWLCKILAPLCLIAESQRIRCCYKKWLNYLLALRFGSRQYGLSRISGELGFFKGLRYWLKGGLIVPCPPTDYHHSSFDTPNNNKVSSNCKSGLYLVCGEVDQVLDSRRFLLHFPAMEV